MNRADALLGHTLDRFGKGEALEAAVAHATSITVAETLQSTPSWNTRPWRDWGIAIARTARHPSRALVLERCFGWIVTNHTRGATPFARSVARRLHGGLGAAVAVAEALDENVVANVHQAWCRLGQKLRSPGQVYPYLVPDLVDGHGESDITRLRGITRWVHDRVEWVADASKWYVPDHWQSPATTLEHASGDCEDMALVLWSALPWLQLPVGRLVVGSVHGEGHAWIEVGVMHGGSVIADATSGAVHATGLAPAYVPSLFIYPDRCEVAWAWNGTA